MSARPPTSSKPPRILACVLCQQRKIKCDRQHPCGHCIKAKAQCVPGRLITKPRRRRFAEKELLDRLRHYEALLREHNISFQPMHPEHPPDVLSTKADSIDGDAQDDETTEADAEKAGKVKGATPSYEAKSFWRELNTKDGEADPDTDTSTEEEAESTVKMTWLKMFESNEHLLFGTPIITSDLSTYHPEQMHIFRLWQIYLDNVDPMIKVTHTLTLQPRIINAALHLRNVAPPLEALMFGMYCMAVSSMPDGQEQQAFGATKNELLTTYQFGCQQALIKCEFLRTNDLEVLIALFLYLLSARPRTDPRSLSPLLGIAVRIAQRMGLHIETMNTKHSAFEAEMRRRVWWALLFIDTRVSEQGEQKTGQMTPTWDCAVPCNVNDSDLHPDMKNRPTAQAPISEAVFTVVRSRIFNTIRTLDCHLDFTIPALKLIAKAMKPDRPRNDYQEIQGLNRGIEEVYLQHCDSENPVHFFTIWTARYFLVRVRLLHYFARSSQSTTKLSDTRRDQGMAHAIAMLECDTRMATNSSIRKFLWFNNLYYPFPAYFQLIQELKTRPTGAQAANAWQVMDENYSTRFREGEDGVKPFHRVLPKHILAAWRARERLAADSGEVLDMPDMVRDLKRRRDGDTPKSDGAPSRTDSSFEDFDLNSFIMPMDMSMSMPNFDNLDFDSMDFSTQASGGVIDWAADTWG
ncbi:hypothetical protein KVT40_004886 [Elsinoe batatas]|uniref:Zn(2)-C6 fungal-type domain-containing protein n=1 Tax=Elsinoe batatas TaxID=2601811 RepID=A0A8K0PHF7_9PEZI|nr:hypothetical protein KVT40_004886 [Elsinoe batatas]